MRVKSREFGNSHMIHRSIKLFCHNYLLHTSRLDFSIWQPFKEQTFQLYGSKVVISNLNFKPVKPELWSADLGLQH